MSNKHYLQNQLKSSGSAYLFWFLLGAHYAYLGRWGVQIMYWITLGGIGIWAIIDLFRMKQLVNDHNAPIFAEIENLERRQRDEDHARNIAMIEAARRNDSNA